MGEGGRGREERERDRETERERENLLEALPFHFFLTYLRQCIVRDIQDLQSWHLKYPIW